MLLCIGTLTKHKFETIMTQGEILYPSYEAPTAYERGGTLKGEVISVKEKSFTFKPEVSWEEPLALALDQDGNITLHYDDELFYSVFPAKIPFISIGDRMQIHYRCKEHPQNNGSLVQTISVRELTWLDS